MKKLIILASLFLASFTTLAAEEISKKDAEGMMYTQKVSLVCGMMGDCHEKIAKMAEEKGADFYVITEAGTVGMGDNLQIVAELFKKINKK